MHHERNSRRRVFAGVTDLVYFVEDKPLAAVGATRPISGLDFRAGISVTGVKYEEPVAGVRRVVSIWSYCYPTTGSDKETGPRVVAKAARRPDDALRCL